MAKFTVYRKGSQISASVYSDENNREWRLAEAAKMSPFFEEVSKDGKPIAVLVFNPMKADVEKSEPTDVFDPNTLKDSDVPKGATVRTWAPVKVADEG